MVPFIGKLVTILYIETNIWPGEVSGEKVENYVNPTKW
jgi:hypothetical protein